MNGAGTTNTTVAADSGPKSDERLAYRGVFQRLLIRPEIGAIIGAIAIWIFFWAVAIPFGTVAGASSILDVSATLGIMAVAVSMLMIGGEFDLSSGASTGALGIVTILLVKETGAMGGAGLSLFLAIPISLAVALFIGWFNGTMVERTSLPSFIVTLGSFFILKGAKLGFSKLIVDQIQVGRIDEGSGYGFWRKIFASEWQRNDHQLSGRDFFYTAGILGGLTIVMIAVHELTFVRKKVFDPKGAVLFVAGLGGGVAGVLVMHAADSTSSNWLAGAIIGTSIVVGFYGYGLWRFESTGDSGPFSIDADVRKSLSIGLAAVAAATVAAITLDSSSSKDLVFLVTEQGLRAMLFVGLAAAGATYMMIAVRQASASGTRTKAVALAVLAATSTFLAFLIRSESTSPKFRGVIFTILLVAAALLISWAISTATCSERRYPDQAADALGRLLGLAGLLAITVGALLRLLFTTDDEIAAGMSPAKFSVRILWFVGVTALATWVLGRTKFGSWTFAVGGNKDAARQVGVPAARTKTQLFMIVSVAAWLVGLLLAFRLNTLQSGTGDGLEFEYIIAAVVGGTMLTGGYGSAFGGAIGAVIMAISKQGIPFSRWNSDWRFVFLGGILLLAVIANNFIRSKAEASR